VDNVIDLRSDTVTKPTPAMRRAMAEAAVGDDYYREDPTVRELEQTAAAVMGKEAAVFVASGTMGNLVSILAQTVPGDEVVLESFAHMYRYEAGHLSAVAGVGPNRVPGINGTMAVSDIERAVRPLGVVYPRTRLICLENTHNAGGGTVLTPAYMADVAEVAARHGLGIHVDGARVFNSAVAQGVPPSELARHATSLTFCLSKGLCCPFGALVLGTAEFIDVCRRKRQMVGGGMRQAGIMAAAGIVALREMVDRLTEDHATARKLGSGLVDLGLHVDLGTVQTNIVMADLSGLPVGAAAFSQLLAERSGVLTLADTETRLRFVTHHGIDEADIERALLGVKEALRDLVGVNTAWARREPVEEARCGSCSADRTV